MRSSRWLWLGLAGLCCTSLLAGSARATAAWAAVKTPGDGPARVFGSPVAGCIAGAEALPVSGTGYRLLQPARLRSFGHPSLIAYLEAFGRSLRAAGLPAVLVGDLGQPRGGPMSGVHASHQTGLDVDVWFAPARPDRPQGDPMAISLVAPDNRAVDRARWREDHFRLLALAAAAPVVDRVFVHPAIKRHLCLGLEGPRDWLQRIRPWYGHDAHFHVRLRCPAGSPECESGPALPEGDGCDDTLAWWFEEEDGRLPAFREVDPPPPPGAPRAAQPLPEACAVLLRAP